MKNFFQQMACRECNHITGDLTHELCRTHAYCARGWQYHGAICAVCDDLWARSKDVSNPEDAIDAFDGLKEWIRGFSKNSRHRQPGQDHFYDQEERDTYQEVHAIHANLKAIAKMEKISSQSETSHMVSIYYYLPEKNCFLSLE